MRTTRTPVREEEQGARAPPAGVPHARHAAELSKLTPRVGTAPPMKRLRRWLMKRWIARRPLQTFHVAAKHLGVTGIEIRVPPTSPLHRAGVAETVELPLDDIIASVVLRTGAWQPEELAFLEAHAPEGPCVLVDVGAHVGLVTRQARHRLPTIQASVSFEPHPHHFARLQRNLAHLPHAHLVNAALDVVSGERTLREDEGNSGNCSFHPEFLADARTRTHVVRCVAATEASILGPLPAPLADAPLLWKSDTQGCDEALMAALPDTFWARVHAGLMELSRIDRPAVERERLGTVLAGFDVRRFTDAPDRDVSVAEILEFVTGRDGRQRDLGFARRRATR